MSVEVAPDLLAFLQQEETRGRNESLELRAETALKSYNGDYYGDEVDGCSKVVARDVAEVVDYMTISQGRNFVSGDRVVEFEPDSSRTEQVADDATEVMHRDFARKGYSLIMDWIKAGNIETLGIVKACAERRKQRTEVMSADPEGDGAIEADSLGVDPDSGMEMFRAIVLQDAPTEFRDYLVPLEEFRIAPETRDPDDAVYIAHASMRTLSELVEMDLCSAEEAETLQGDELPSTLSQARDGGLETVGIHRSDVHRRVLLLEEYVLFDADRDGIAERLCVHRVGNTVLRIEECDYQPFVIYCPFPMPGRLAGHSLADKVTDIQRIRTALMRLNLDGLYRNLAPRTYVPDDCVNENTYDDLLTVIPGGLVRYRGVQAPTPEPKNDVSAIALQASEALIAERESRTGITRLNQGLDADALNKTATGTALMQAQGQQMEEYLARNFAEALARLMRLKLKLRARYGQPMRLRVDGEYRDIDPSQWPEDMEVMIRVGLGSGRKEQRLMNRMNLLNIQRECMLGGLPIVQPEHIYKSIAGVVKDANLGSPADFVADPSTLPPQEPQPDPEMMKVQAQLQMDQAKHEGDMQIRAADLQGKQQEGALKLQLSQQESAAKLQLEAQKAEFEREQAIAQMMFERELAVQKLEHEKQLAFYKADKDAEAKRYREGGSLAQ
jgi:hypothetical protein